MGGRQVGGEGTEGAEGGGSGSSEEQLLLALWKMKAFRDSDSRGLIQAALNIATVPTCTVPHLVGEAPVKSSNARSTPGVVFLCTEPQRQNKA